MTATLGAMVLWYRSAGRTVFECSDLVSHILSLTALRHNGKPDASEVDMKLRRSPYTRRALAQTPEPDGAVPGARGHWLSQRGLPEPSGALSELQAARVSHLHSTAPAVAAWDSTCHVRAQVARQMQARA